MAIKTWYATSNLASVHQEMSETDPGAEVFASPVVGCVIGNSVATVYAIFDSQVETSNFTNTAPFAAIDTTNGDCLRTTNPYTGTFVAGTWEMHFCVRANTVASGQRMQVYFRLLRSTNANGSGATAVSASQFASGTPTGGLLTTATHESTLTFNPGAFSLTNEYLFVQICYLKVAAGGMTTADANMRIGNASGMGTRIVSTNLSTLQALTMPAAQGSFGVTGQPVSVLWGQRAVALPAGSFALTGQAVAFPKGKSFPLDRGAFNLLSPTGLNDSDPITIWPDSTGNGNYGTIGGGSVIIKLGILNGLPVARMADGWLSLAATAYTGAPPWTIFTIMRPTSGALFMAGLGMAGGGSYPSPEDNTFGPYQHLTGGTYLAAGTMWNNPAAVDYSGFHIYTGTVTDYATATFYTDGFLQTLNLMTSGTPVGVFNTIGRRNSQLSTGDLVEIIYYNVALSATDRANIEAGLALKWGLYALSGTPVSPTSVAGLVGWWKADAVVGGGGTIFRRSRTTPLAFGAYGLTGQTTGLKRARITPISQGGYTLGGQPVALKRGKLMALVFATYNLTGQATALRRTRIAGLVAGAYNLAGQAANLVRARKMPATQGAYLLTGIPTGLTVITAKTLNAIAGAFSLAGQATGLIRKRLGTVITGSYNLNGQPMNVQRGRGTAATQGTFNMTGQPTGLKTSRRIPTVTGGFTLTGQAQNLLRGRRIVQAFGAYSWSGQPVNLKTGRNLALVRGLYALSGQPTGLRRARIAPAGPGAFNLTGRPTGLQWARRMIFTTGTYATTGQDIILVSSGGESWLFFAGSKAQSTLLATAAASILKSTAAGADFKAMITGDADIITGLAVWLDASQIALADGADISPWPNIANPAVPGTIYKVGIETNPTLRRNALGGKAVVRFTVSQGRLRMTGIGATNDFTLIYVGRQLIASPGRVVGAIYPTGGNFVIGYHGGYMDNAYDGAFFAPSVQKGNDGTWRLYSADRQPAGVTRMFIGGVYANQGVGTEGWGGTLAISGYSPDTSPETCDCEIAELRIYVPKIPDADRTALENLMNAKWALGLPLGAPPALAIGEAKTTSILVGTPGKTTSDARISLASSVLKVQKTE